MTPLTPDTHPSRRSYCSRFASRASIINQTLKSAGLRSLPLVLLAAPFMAAQTVAPARIPFQQQVVLSIDNGGPGGFSPVSVPAGQRLIIEYVSLSGSAPAGQKLSASIQTTVASATAAYSVVVHVQESADGTDRLVANQMMKIYAEAEFHVACWRSKVDGPAQMTFNISGYLESIQ
jgi:hypothetical protein